MADQTAPAPTICPWCSAPLPADAVATCPSCGATLKSDTEPQLPGVTAIDAEAIVRAARAPTPQRRNRLLSWISGEYEEATAETETAPGSLAPPPPDVRREILRLELEAEVANLQAEADSMKAEAEVEAREQAGEIAPDDAVSTDGDSGVAVADASADEAAPEETAKTG